MEDLLKLQYRLTHDKVQQALEMSKRGGHLWIFLAPRLLAEECRIYIHDLSLRLGVPINGAAWLRASRCFRSATPSTSGSLATPFADSSESTAAPIADFSFMALTTRSRIRSHTSTVCGRSLRKNCGGSSLARNGLSRISRPVRRGALQRCENLGTYDQNSAFWNT